MSYSDSIFVTTVRAFVQQLEMAKSKGGQAKRQEIVIWRMIAKFRYSSVNEIMIAKELIHLLKA